MNPESPFDENWLWFGFCGEPEPGNDYSWIFVQNNLDLVGRCTVIPNCTIFFSSRKPNAYLVKTQDGHEELWDTTDCQFSICSTFGNILSVSEKGHSFHLSGISTSFIELLMRAHKLPSDSLSDVMTIQSQQIEIIRSTQQEPLPEEVTNIQESAEHKSIVSVIGSNIPEEIKGNLIATAKSVVINGDGDNNWSVSISDINNVRITEISKWFIIFNMKDESRYEVCFDESAGDEARKCFDLIAKALSDYSSLLKE